MNDWSTCPAIESQPGKVSGAWVFKGTGVPVSALFNNLKSGATIEEFMDWFPGVTRQQVESILSHQIESLESGAVNFQARQHSLANQRSQRSKTHLHTTTNTDKEVKMTTQGRDPNIDLEKVGIRLGDILTLHADPNITCIVTRLYPTQVAYDGQLLSISAAAQRARNVSSANGAVEWTFDGKTLDQRRRDFEDWHKLSG